ncbi:MAG: DUF2268 domain-containing protein [Defluviitaleaceae bacterium]|nr:DUF2268 domain-containing protein [Defluviitaleaceae bacterium]
MEINVITTFENSREFLKDGDWAKHMIEPFWADIAQHAPFDQSFKQPKPIKDLESLKVQLDKLEKLDIVNLKLELEQITAALPSDDDDPILVALFPICNSNERVREWQSGVVGTSVFGNVVININPLADDWERWLPFVFAHEYHHNIWGHHWYVQRGGEGLTGSFLEYMITEGQADLFAMSLFPGLSPSWNQPRDDVYWNEIKPILHSTDQAVHAKYMFGDKDEGLPWCLGYSFGRTIVEDFLHSNPMTFSELLNVPSKEIFKASRYFD